MVLCRAGPRCCSKPGHHQLLAIGCASPPLRGFPALFSRWMNGFWGARLLFSILCVSPLRSLMWPPTASSPEEHPDLELSPVHPHGTPQRWHGSTLSLHSTATPRPRKPLLCPWGPSSSPAPFPPPPNAARPRSSSQLPSLPAPGSVTLGHGQCATSLPPSSVSTRAHEQRRDRKTPQKARKDRDEPSPGSAGPGDKPFGDSVGRDVPAAAATAPRLRPPSCCRRGGRSLQGRPTLCERRGAVSQAGSSVVGAGLRNSRGEVGWRPLSSRTVGARSGERRGDAGAPVSPSCVRSSSRLGHPQRSKSAGFSLSPSQIYPCCVLPAQTGTRWQLERAITQPSTLPAASCSHFLAAWCTPAAPGC